MITLSELSFLAQGMIQAIALLMLLAALFSCLFDAVFKAPGRYGSLCFLIFYFSFFTLLLHAYSSLSFIPEDKLSQFFLKKPALIIGLLLLFSLFWLGFAIRRQLQWKRTHLSQLSIKESIDQLPTGICFFAENGLPKLVNHRMQQLSRQLTGSEILNAKRFWQALQCEALLNGCQLLQSGEAPVIRLPDQSVWLFEKRPLTLDREKLFQLTACSITDEYRLSQQLEAENERLKEMNRRLKAYGATVEAVTREKEMYEAKVRIHDELGKILLTARRYQAEKAPEEKRAALLAIWRQNAALFTPVPAPPQNAEGMEPLIQAARAIGVELICQGALPESGPEANLMEAAAREALTNAVRHGDASRLFLEGKKEMDTWEITFTNNGKPPSGQVQEGGGLSSLRRRIENAGGTMSLCASPRFALRIQLPCRKEGQDSWPTV